jgi:xanthine/uracil permease
VKFRYGLEERPPLGALFLFGLQWLAVVLPGIVITGRIASGLHPGHPGGEVLYIQKLCFVTACTLLGQVLWGHRLPLVAGPAAVLLIGVIASRGFPPGTVHSAIAAGGLTLALLSVTGLFRRLQPLFTARVVAAVLLLIAFTLAPQVLRLIVGVGNPGSPPGRLVFALGFLPLVFLAHRLLSGLWKSTLIIWAMAVGSLACFVLLGPGPMPAGAEPTASLFSGFFRELTLSLSFDPGVLVSIAFCFLALSVNDLGSIQAMDPLLRPAAMPARITRGLGLTGLANALAGFFGVIGPVDFSLSPGVIAASGCASRFTLIPTAVMLALLAFSPAAIDLVGLVPPVVIGCVLTYILCAQVAAGLTVLFSAEEGFSFSHGLTIALPLLLGTVISFLPPAVLEELPTLLRPILGNGFVVGVVAALILEHVVFRE